MPTCPFPRGPWSLSRRLDTTCTLFPSRGRCPLYMVLRQLLYCRNQDVWGPDAHQFRPERWFEMKEQAESPVGVYGNLYGQPRNSDAMIEY